VYVYYYNLQIIIQHRFQDIARVPEGRLQVTSEIFCCRRNDDQVLTNRCNYKEEGGKNANG
jgi:hypothetical protein